MTFFTFTETELRDAGRRHSAPTTADTFIKSMKAARKDGGPSLVTGEFQRARVITQEELEDALKRRGYSYSDNQAEDIVNNIITHREPEYIVEKVYRSGTGKLYKKVAGGWVTFGDGITYPDSMPTRPLHELPGV
jgi:hypothetical protein